MNTLMTVPVSAGLGEDLAFLAFPAKRASEEVSEQTETMVRSVSNLTKRILEDVVSSRTAEEFRAARKKHLGRYMQIMIAMSELIGASIDKATIERLTAESLSEMEQSFKEDRQVFGEEIGEQAAFTVWTLAKINDLVQRCNAQKVANSLADADRDFARQYVGYVLSARFHLDCLYTALVNGRSIFPGPLEQISEGLRAAVDAYAWVRSGLELRSPEAEEEKFDDIPWDSEQDDLMRESSADLLRECY